MKSPIISLVFLIILALGAIKFVAPVNKWARATLPPQVLGAIGEEPIGLLEQGLDELKSLIK
ncbi:MAG: hypothetical protein QNL04_11990 [SAR324 cluster bacterium]|nr:hypothetical protein [SAR324 cluster bacterium]